MKELNLNYYFENIENFTFKEIFNECNYPWEVLNKIKSFLFEKVENNNLHINKAEMGEFVSFNGNYFIDEGTKIHSNVTIEGPVLIRKKRRNTISEH